MRAPLIDIEQWPAVEVAINDLTPAESPRLSRIDDAHAENLAAALDRLPPIIVHRATMRTIDGNHRIRAALLCGRRTIAARFFDGDETAAFVLAVQLNVTHGLPLSVADRKRAAERIIRAQPRWSDRRVASVSSVSPGTVAAVRRRLAGAGLAADSRVGQDGRVRPVDVSAGRRLAAQLLTEDPTLSLRQVARRAAISPETVRDVRNRLRRGDTPAQPGPAGADIVVPIRRQFAAGAPAVLAGRAPARRSVPAAPGLDSAKVVGRLTTDPALRFTDNGRNLLRLLSLHQTLTSNWDGMVGKVPANCNDVVVDLARQFADLWNDLASRAGAGPSASGGTARTARTA